MAGATKTRRSASGGDQKIRGNGGYVGEDSIPRLNVLDLQRLIRVVPKPVVAMVNGYAIGGGHVLHILCDLSIAAETAKFGQTGPKVGSFDAGYGAGYLAAIVGQKKAREIWYLCRQYTAAEALEMGLVNKVVPFEALEAECVAWAREMLAVQPHGAALHEGCRSTQRPTAWQAFSSWPATRRFCTTRPTRRRKAATRSRRSARPTSRSSPSSRKGGERNGTTCTTLYRRRERPRQPERS